MLLIIDIILKYDFHRQKVAKNELLIVELLTNIQILIRVCLFKHFKMSNKIYCNLPFHFKIAVTNKFIA